MRGKVGNKVRLHHILDAISEIERYLQNVSYEQFLNNSEKRFATIKQIEIIGEACNALTDELKLMNHEIPWKAIIGFRNFRYMNISESILNLYGKFRETIFPT